MNKIVNCFIDLIKDNKNILDKIKKEDDDVFAFRFNVKQLIEELVKYKNKTISKEKGKKIFVSHYGSPYITAVLCLEAIRHNCELVVGIEEICYGLNTAIIKMINDALKEVKIQKQIILKMDVTSKEFAAMNCDQLICLGNSNAYTNFKENQNIRYVPFFDLVLYYNSTEYEDLIEDIRNYAIGNLHEIEIFDETEDLEEVLDSINHSLPRHCAVILTKDKQKQERFKQAAHAKIICVNENPFHKFKLEIPEEVFGES